MLTVGLSGVGTWRKAPAILAALGAQTVRVALDADARTNPAVARALAGLVELLQKRCLAVELELWDATDGKGIDDLLAAGKTPTIVTGEAVTSAVAAIVANLEDTKASKANADRRKVVIQPEEHKVIGEVVAALAASDTDLYQRGGQLIHIVCEPRPDADEGRKRSASRIVPVPLANLRSRITKAVQIVRPTKDGDKSAHPPRWLAPGVAAAAPWAGIRPLEAVSPAPVLRQDGTILQTPGYDAATGVLYEPRGHYPFVPEGLNQKAAAAAAAEICDVVCDFPFEAPEHKSGWVAGVLTSLARSAYSGPAPLFLIDANVPAAGKSLLADAAGVIAGDSGIARRSYPTGRDRADEMRKVITALAVAGERLVLLDNLPSFLGDSSLDMALTATEWSDRILGHTQTVRVPLLMTWWATGNNVTTVGDTSRRILPIRLMCPDEHPEQRAGFKHPDLLAWLRRERDRLVTSALTILAAYIRAGRPDMNLRPWGSYEGWSGLVRAAVVWAGLPDPRNVCCEFVSRADTETAALGAMLDAWLEIDGDGQGLTVAALLRTLKGAPASFHRLREALTEFCPARSGDLPDAHRLGIQLRRFARRNVGGRWFDNHTSGKVAVWFVRVAPRAAPMGNAGVSGDWSGESPPVANARLSPCMTTMAATPETPASPVNNDDSHGDAWEGPDPPTAPRALFGSDGPYLERR